jgi:radical SAM protein with 4Fe4S-binding SPASM domain
MIDLNKNRKYIQSYIDLRNKYTEELKTKVITVESTVDWFDSDKHGAIHCEIEDNRVVAAVIVHYRQEVTVFSDKKGLGDKLLAEAETMAFELGMVNLWAKVNKNSRKLFLRNGYKKEGELYSKNLHYSDKYGLRDGAKDFPMMVVLSFVFVCNSRCPNCPYNNSDIRKTYKDALYFPIDLFGKIADECGQYGSVLRLSGGGEPFLHKHIVELTKYATDKGCKVSIITNGSVDVSGVLDIADMIEFSVDAGNQEEYSIARPGLDWGFLNTNIETALKTRKTTKLICSIINQKGINVEAAKNYWEYLDAVQIRKFLTWGYNKDNSANDIPYLPPEERIPCPCLFERTSIDTRGDVTFCPEDIGYKYKFDNVRNKSIKEIWHCKTLEDARRLHLNKQGDKLPPCGHCADWMYRTWNFNYWKLREHASSNITT